MVTVFFKDKKINVKDSLRELSLCEISEIATAHEVFSSYEFMLFQFSVLLQTSIAEVADNLTVELHQQMLRIVEKLNSEFESFKVVDVDRFVVCNEEFLVEENLLKTEFGRYIMIDDWILKPGKLSSIETSNLRPISELIACLAVKVVDGKRERFSELEFTEVQRRAQLFWLYLDFERSVSIYNFFLRTLKNFVINFRHSTDKAHDQSQFMSNVLRMRLGGYRLSVN